MLLSDPAFFAESFQQPRQNRIWPPTPTGGWARDGPRVRRSLFVPTLHNNDIGIIYG
jgi:hypothetical protein